MANKEAVTDLAIFGGPASFAAPLHVGRPNIGDRAAFLERVNDLLDRRWLTNHGPYAEEFEREIAQSVGARHCIAVCNATVALEIATRACGLSGEVIVPSFTFVATAHALQWQQITPVFCDIDPETANLDPARVETLITPRTTGILGVHVWGRPCDVDGLSEIARRHGLRLLFDAAHAYGCSRGGIRVGNFGDAEVFSFHATKFVNSFEGGAIVTNDDELAAKIRLMTNFGFIDYDQTVSVGTNGKMSEVSAAMGLTSLEHVDDFIGANARNYASYRADLANIPGISLISFDEQERCNFQYVVLEIDEEYVLSRDELLHVLWAENVLARRYFYPACHRMEPYRSLYPHAGLLLPHTERMTSRVLQLPTGTAVGAAEIGKICSLIRWTGKHADEVRSRLEGVRSRQFTPVR
jgi:dTDP-4-amino-4,6-dideoxygalactose transaminase